jgi:hypothetical protein
VLAFPMPDHIVSLTRLSRLMSGFDSLVASVSIYVQIEAVGARKEQSTT